MYILHFVKHNFYTKEIICYNTGLGFWCLMPLSTIFQLYCGGAIIHDHYPEYQIYRYFQKKRNAIIHDLFFQKYPSMWNSG